MMKVIVTLITYQDWVWSHPDPSLVGNYYIAGGNVYTDEKGVLRQLVQRGWHTNPSPTEVDWIGVTEAPRPRRQPRDGRARIGGRMTYMPASLNVVIDEESGEILNANGNLVRRTPGGGKSAFAVTLAQGSDGRWRISDIYKLRPTGGLAELAR